MEPTAFDRLCIEIDRNPSEITRSMFVPAAYDDTLATREALLDTTEAGFGHIVIGLSPPYPVGVANWVADELIAPSRRA